MVKLHQYILRGVLLILVSCSISIGNQEQRYPAYNFESVTSIEVIRDHSEITAFNRGEINDFLNFLKDSANYFKNDQVVFNGSKSLFSIHLANPDTLILNFYNVEDQTRIEVAYFDLAELNKSGWKQYYRFYINSDVLKFVALTE